MKKTSLIGHVCELLDLILPLKQPADVIAKDFFRTRHYLGSKDRRFISEVTFGILRHFKLLRTFANEGLKVVPGATLNPLALYIAYALRISGEEKESILEDVESSWRISFPKFDCRQFIAAVSESQLSEEIRRNPVQRLAITYSFPGAIVEEWIQRFGEGTTEKLCAGMNKPAPTVLRVNTLKMTLDECRLSLQSEQIESEPTRISPVGLVLKKRINASAVQSYKDGLFEMQDEGSQLISFLVDPQPGEIVVDACAGGGGKTLHLAALMKNEGQLHAMDVDTKRLDSISPRLARAGVTIARLHLVQKNGDDSVLQGLADKVLVDAPCSGIGTYRRNPGAKLSFNESFVEHITKTQRKVLNAAAAMVKEGGRLVYSTCTLLAKENEDVIQDFLANHPEFTVVSASEILRQYDIQIESSSNYLMLLPHETDTDGFFAAVLQRGK